MTNPISSTGLLSFLTGWFDNSEKEQIVSPNGIYHGAFANNNADPAHLVCFEQMAGQDVDIALRYINFQELRSKEPFPVREAEYMRRRGGALFLVLEPGSGKKPSDITFPVSKIIAGKYDKELVSFAKMAKNYGGPVFLTFRPWNTLAVDPKEKKEAFLKIRSVLQATGAKNVTLVWSIDLNDKSGWENAPRPAQFSWVSVTVYGNDDLKKLEANLPAINKLGRPIMVQFGIVADPPEKIDFIMTAVKKFNDLGIKAIIYSNVSQAEGGIFKRWAITGREEKGAYARALAALTDPTHESRLRESIRTGEGYLKKGVEKPDLPSKCEVIETRYQTAEEAKQTEGLNQKIKNIENYLNGLIGGDPHYDNKKRIELSQAYQDLFFLSHDDKHLARAEHLLAEIFQNPDPVLIYHWSQRFVREYFEASLRLADFYTLIDSHRALGLTNQLLGRLSDLEKVKYVNPSQGRKESVPGFKHKALEIKAKIMDSLGDIDQAISLYQQVIDWSDNEYKQTFRATFPAVWNSTWFRGEDINELKYNGAKARLSQGDLFLKKGDPGSAAKALALFKTVLDWPLVGQEGKTKTFIFLTWTEDGYMDLAYKALIGLLRLSANASDFDSTIDWRQFNGYKDLKKSLQIEDVDLTDLKQLEALKTDRRQLILDGLSNIALTESLMIQLDMIRSRQR